MPTKHSSSETFLLAILLFVCIVLYLVYVVWYGSSSNNAVALQTLTATSITPTPNVQTRVAVAQAIATSQTATAIAKLPTKTFTPTNTPRPLSDQLMDIITMEADVSKHTDVQKALSLYAPDAEIIDAASGTKWIGLDQIKSRYVDTFNQFKFLENNDEFGDLQQDSPISATVWVTQTGTVLNLSGGTPFPTPANRESWQFVKLNEGWKIKVFTYFMPTFYTIMNRNSQLYLEGISNTAIVQNYFRGADSQKWQFVQIDNDFYQIKDKQRGLCIDIDGQASVVDGIIQRGCDKTRDTQLWHLQWQGNSSYFLMISKHSDPVRNLNIEMCIDIQQFKRDAMEQPIYFDCNPTRDGTQNANQLWLRQAQ